MIITENMAIVEPVAVLRKPKTIAKNRKKLIDSIFSNATQCKVYTLENGFRGADCPIEWARKELYQFGFAKLILRGIGETGTHYTLQVHSNLWVEIESLVKPN